MYPGKKSSGIVKIAVTASMVLGLSAVSNVATADGWFEIKAVSSGKCVEVGGGNKSNGAAINQWSCNGNDNQLWTWAGKRIKNKHSGRCLDVTGVSKDDIVPLQQYGCTGGANQSFKYTSDKRLVAEHSGKCVDIKHASSDDGKAVIQFHCKANAFTNQQFDLVKK